MDKWDIGGLQKISHPTNINTFRDLWHLYEEHHREISEMARAGHTNHDLLGMLKMRLRIPSNKSLPFQFINAFEIDKEHVAVFIVHNNTPAMFTDEGGLYPSDKLVTQLRLLLG